MMRKILVLVISIITAILVSTPIYILEESFNAAYSNDTRAIATRELTRIKEILRADLQSALNYAQFLEIIIQQNPDFDEIDFEVYAEMITDKNAFIYSAVFAPQGIVTYVYPENSSLKSFKGDNLLTNPDKRSRSLYALKNRTAVVQGPTDEAGKLIVYNRQPVFVGDVFFGFVSIAVDFKELFETHEIEMEKENILYGLQINSELNEEKNSFRWGSRTIFENKPLTEVLELSGEEWVLGAYPVGGWEKRPEGALPIHLPFYIVFIVVFLLTYQVNSIYLKRRHEAFYDGLTQTMNKRHIENYIKKQLRDRTDIDLVLLIDLNDFKEINDKYGHMAGDYVLAEISERLRAVLRKEDKVGRIGGDEFMVYLPDITSDEHRLTAIHTIREALLEEIVYQGHHFMIEASIGWVFTNQESSFERLYKLADERMYEDKNEAKSYYL